MALLLFIAILCPVAFVLGSICPPESIDLGPCYCQEQDDQAALTCNNIDEPRTLSSVLDNLTADWPITSLVLRNSNLPFIPSAEIVRKRLKNIRVRDTTLLTLFEEALSEENEIRLITLHNVRLLSGVQWELFKPLLKLKVLLLDHVEVETLGKSFIDNIPSSLNYLELADTNTKELAYNAFANLKKLEDIRIANNQISILNTSMFAYPSELKGFGFPNNQIEHIPITLFRQMPLLTHVYLNDNRLHRLSEDIFGSLLENGNAIYVNVADNPLICDCSIQWFVKNYPEIELYGYCDTPVHIKAKNIQDLETDDFDFCPLNY